MKHVRGGSRVRQPMSEHEEMG